MAQCSTGKTIVRGVVITALAGGVLVAVAGPHRVGAMFDQARTNITQVIDDNIEDPVMLRAQIKKLAAQYPEKIAEVRSDLSEVRSQIAQLDREMQVAQKVVHLASIDLETVDAQISRARLTQSQNPGAIVRVSFDDRALGLDEAYTRRQRIGQTRELYQTRASDLGTDLSYLNDQEAQLAELLDRLETERAEFQAKITQLDAQIDTIERNERMIAMMEDRQETIDAHSSFQAHSLDQLNGRLSTIRSEQRSRLEAIAGRENDRDYVDEAEFLIDRSGRETDTEGAGFAPERSGAGGVIEITPDYGQEGAPVASSD